MVKDQTVLKEIREAVDFLEKYFKIKQIILFGSFLSGNFDEYSDIDLAIISPDFENKTYEEIINVFAKLSVMSKNRIELHPFSENDFKNAKPTNFIGYLLKNGEVIFDDNKFITAYDQA